jgi:phage repressor protein C with HTH and peptisase S24 domain
MSNNQLNIDRGERLKMLRETHFKIKTASEFAEIVGVPQSNYSIIEKGQRDISNKILEFISNQYKINLNWLLFGQGDPFLKKESPIISNGIILYNKPNVTLYNIDASAGGLIAIQDENGQPLDQWFIPDLIGQHIAVNVAGNSMSPSINDGDKIVAKEIFRNDLRDGYIYIVVATDGSVRVKRLRLYDNLMLLWSDNPAFDPRSEKLILEDIIKIYHVVMVCKAL